MLPQNTYTFEYPDVLNDTQGVERLRNKVGRFGETANAARKAVNVSLSRGPFCLCTACILSVFHGRTFQPGPARCPTSLTRLPATPRTS